MGYRFVLYIIFIFQFLGCAVKTSFVVETSSNIKINLNKPQLILSSEYFSKTRNIHLQVLDCTNVSGIYLTQNVSFVPIGTENEWQDCHTQPNYYQVQLDSQIVGIHYVYAWAKYSNGKISESSKAVAVKYVPQFLIGQSDFQTFMNRGIGAYVTNQVRKLNGKFYFVSSGGGNVGLPTFGSRVSIYNQEPNTMNNPATTADLPNSYVLSNFNDISLAGQRGPTKAGNVFAVDSDGTKLAVVDTTNHRVLIWNTLPTNPEVPADLVLGQQDFYTGVVNDGKGATPDTLDCSDLNDPRNVRFYGGKLYVVDSGNRRVLVWNQVPTVNNQAADFAIAQPDCASNVASSSTLNKPVGIDFHDTKMFLADSNNHRVLIWNTLPTTFGLNANVVLGQNDLASSTSNLGGLSKSSLSGPRGVTTDGQKLIVSDYSNNRLLVWNTIPTTNKAVADVVIGQVDGTQNSANRLGAVSAKTLWGPISASVIDGHLWVADSNNQRYLKYSGIPATDDEAAIKVIAQPNFATIQYGTIGAGATTLNRPYEMIFTDDDKMVISEFLNSRILFYNQIPQEMPTAQNLIAADYVWGQDDLVSLNANRNLPHSSVTGQGLSGPKMIRQLNGKFYVNDGYYRFLVFNQLPTSTAAIPDYVLGQANFTSGSYLGVTASSFGDARDITSDGQRLVVTDLTHHRVLIWNNIPTISNQPADVVVGQPNMTTGSLSTVANNVLYNPYSAIIAENKLIVADNGNRRLLIYNSIPTSNGAAADIVIGQPDMNTRAMNTTADWNLQMTPIAVVYHEGRLMVSNSLNNNILIWNSIPTTNNQLPDQVIGIPYWPNRLKADPVGLNEFYFNNVYRFTTDGHRLFVTDYSFYRSYSLPIPEVSITSATMTQNPNARLTVHRCNDRTKVMFTETNNSPSVNASGWETCNTTRNHYQFSVNDTDGLKSIYTWFKDSQGIVMKSSQVSYFWLFKEYKGTFFGSINVSGRTNMSALTYTPGEGHVTSRQLLFKENSSVPDSDDGNWKNTDNTVSFNVSTSTEGPKSIYVFSKDPAGIVSPVPNRFDIVIDTTPPTLPTMTLMGGQVTTFGTVIKLTASTCSEISKLYISESSTPPTASQSGWITCSTVAGGNSFTVNSLTEGNHQLNIWAQDSAGNVTVNSQVVTVNFNSFLAIGQSNLTSIDQAADAFSNPIDITVSSDGAYYAVTDAGNHRVLIYNNDPITSTPIIVLGQNSLTQVGASSNITDVSNLVTAANFNNPYGVSIVGNSSSGYKIIVSDDQRNRVLIWNSMPTSHGQNADIVLGQSNFSNSGANSSQSTRNCSGFSNPRIPWSDGTKLIIPDYSNNRIMIWNTFPTVNNQVADVIVGQSSCSGNGSGTTNSTLKNPIFAMIDNNKLYVSDLTNHRVLIYNQIPTGQTINGVLDFGGTADVVIGQASMTGGSANQGGSRTNATLNGPTKLQIMNSKLYISDRLNARVLIFDSLPTASNASANSVIGTGSATAAANGMSSAIGLAVFNSKMWVADYNLSQIRRFDSITNGASYSAVKGSFLPTIDYYGNLHTINTTNANQLARPMSSIIVGTKLIVSDYFHHRVLIWNTIPTSQNQAADVVIGQPDLTSLTRNNSAVTSASGRLSYPAGVASDGTKLFIADNGNNRVLVFNTIPTVNGAFANVALGQPDMATYTAGTSASKMNSPQSIAIDGDKIFVADFSNNRVLAWWDKNTLTIGKAADYVLGQNSMTAVSANQGGTASAQTMYNPRIVNVSGGKLLVSEFGNNRVLIWNTIPSSTSAANVAADVVVGQSSFSGVAAATTAVGLSRPYMAQIINGKLFICDYSNARILIYNTVPTANGASADWVIGQSTPTAFSINNRGISGWSVYLPTEILFDNNKYWITDMGNHRLIQLELPF